jgi:predicted nuclease of predicted toxin-antitoxin system
MKNGDKEIALTAKRENAVMITDDNDFLEGLKHIKQSVMNFEEFLIFLQIPNSPAPKFNQ